MVTLVADNYWIILMIAISIPLVTDDSSNWYIRHCVILSLSRICYYCKDLPTQDGMSEIAWSILQKRMSLELEPKVLEANNLHQVSQY